MRTLYVPVREAPINDTVATGSSPAVGWVAGGVPENTGVGSPQPVATGEPPVEEEQGAETFWSLLAKAGNMVW